MAGYSDKEKLTLSLIVDNVTGLIYRIESGQRETDKLVFSTCLNNEEKMAYVKREIKKLQESFESCHPDAAPYILAFIHKHPLETENYDQWRDRVVGNFISGEYYHDLFLQISKEHEFEEFDDLEFSDYILHYNYDAALFEAFVDMFAKAERYIGFKEFLEIDEEENEKVILTVPPGQKGNSLQIAFTYSKKGASSQNNLTEFRKCLVDNGFIDKSIKLADFKKIFKNELPDGPIKWLGNLSELYYLIKSIHNDKKLVENTGKDVWKITSNCFVDSNGETYDFKKFRGQKIPASYKKLDKIISVL